MPRPSAIASGRDFDRRLNERGRADAPRMGEEMRKLGLDFDLILSSPAARAAETAKLAGLSPRFDQRIYDASAGELLAIVQEADDGRQADDGRPQSRVRATGIPLLGKRRDADRIAGRDRASDRQLERCGRRRRAAGPLPQAERAGLGVERGREAVANGLQSLDVDPPLLGRDSARRSPYSGCGTTLANAEAHRPLGLGPRSSFCTPFTV